MKIDLSQLPDALVGQEPLLLQMFTDALSNVPFHHDTPAITRYTARQFPLHLGVHQVSPVQTPPAEYTEPHVHDDHDEVNLILSDEDLTYRIRLGDEELTVSNNACIWIPRGVVHSANVLKGSGYYIALRLN